MDPGPLRDALTVLVGLGSGVLSGVFGVGGTVVSTPGIRVLGATALASVATTLPSVIPGALSGTTRYVRAGLIDWRVVRWAAPVGVVGSVLGALLTDDVPGEGHPLMVATAVLLGFSAWRMAFPGRAARHEEGAGADGGGRVESRPASPVLVAGVGAVAGVLSGLLGIGGGVVMVPGFNQYARLGLKRSIATSLACVGLLAIPGTITHGALGDIDWRFALLLAAGIVPGAQLGAAVAVKARTPVLRIVVSSFLGLVAVAYAAAELHSWLAA